MIGVHFEDDHVATGFGNHLARPILREEWRDDLTFKEGCATFCIVIGQLSTRFMCESLSYTLHPMDMLDCLDSGKIISFII